MGDADAESRQELFSRLGRDAPKPAMLAKFSNWWAATRREAAVAFADVQGVDAISPPPWGGAIVPVS
jgi:hypothetical protein